jgi:transposase
LFPLKKNKGYIKEKHMLNFKYFFNKKTNLILENEEENPNSLNKEISIESEDIEFIGKDKDNLYTVKGKIIREGGKLIFPILPTLLKNKKEVTFKVSFGLETPYFIKTKRKGLVEIIIREAKPVLGGWIIKGWGQSIIKNYKKAESIEISEEKEIEVLEKVYEILEKGKERGQGAGIVTICSILSEMTGVNFYISSFRDILNGKDPVIFSVELGGEDLYGYGFKSGGKLTEIKFSEIEKILKNSQVPKCEVRKNDKENLVDDPYSSAYAGFLYKTKKKLPFLYFSNEEDKDNYLASPSQKTEPNIEPKVYVRNYEKFIEPEQKKEIIDTDYSDIDQEPSLKRQDQDQNQEEPIITKKKEPIEPVPFTEPETEEPIRRGRGRPPGTFKKKEPIEPVPFTEPETQEPIRRGRGRPPGTFKKKEPVISRLETFVPDQEEIEVDIESENTPETSEKFNNGVTTDGIPYVDQKAINDALAAEEIIRTEIHPNDLRELKKGTKKGTRPKYIYFKRGEEKDLEDYKKHGFRGQENVNQSRGKKNRNVIITGSKTETPREENFSEPFITNQEDPVPLETDMDDPISLETSTEDSLPFEEVPPLTPKAPAVEEFPKKTNKLEKIEFKLAEPEGATIEEITKDLKLAKKVVVDYIKQKKERKENIFSTLINQNDPRFREDQKVYFTKSELKKEYIMGNLDLLSGKLPEATVEENSKIIRIKERLEAFKFGQNFKSKSNNPDDDKEYQKFKNTGNLVSNEEELDDDWETGKKEPDSNKLRSLAIKILLKFSSSSGKTISEISNFTKIEIKEIKKILNTLAETSSITTGQMKSNDLRYKGKKEEIYFFNEVDARYYTKGNSYYSMNESKSIGVKKIFENIKRWDSFRRD